MNRLREVCFVVALSATPAVAQSAAPALQKGVSVQMVVTTNAVAVPGADAEDALIVSVTASHMVFLGTERVGPTALAGKLKGVLSSHRETKVYIKADARAPYADVTEVLRAVRRASVNAPILLTAQGESPRPGIVVPPRGLEVFVSPPTSSTTGPVIIEDQSVTLAALDDRLDQLFRSGRDRVVLLSAKGLLSFADVATVTDACRSTGAKVFLLRAEP
jgi:biopolymer transport protein ExbD